MIHVNRKFYTACAAFLLIIWPLVAAIGLYALGQPLPSLALLTSPRFLAMQLIVDYAVMLTFVACALLFNKRTAKHANVIDELQIENDNIQEKLVKSERENGELQDELASVRAELRKVKLELLHAKEEANLAKLHYESLRKAYSEATLDLLKIRSELKDTRSKLDLTNRILCDEIVAADNALYDAEALQSERDDLQSKLATARRFVRRLLAERNKLRYELTKARIGFGFFRREYVDAEARVAYAQQQIKDLESAVEARDDVIGSLLDDVVIRTKG